MTFSFSVGPVYVGSRVVKERRIPHSLNARLHWAKRYQWDLAWKEQIWTAIYQNRRFLGKLPFEQARVKFTLHTMKVLDLDNAYTCIKPLLDGLKTHVLVDDNPNCIKLKVSQVKVKHRKEEHVLIEVERIIDAPRPNRIDAEGSPRKLAA
jgi:hypothetical protein